MSHEIDFTVHPSYLFAHVTGVNSPETVFAYMADIRERCAGESCFRVLIHECLEGPRMNPMDVFDIAVKGSMEALGEFDAIAYVDENMGEMAEFLETVAVNRGMPIRVFKTIETARSWMEAQQDDSDSQRIFTGGGHPE